MSYILDALKRADTERERGAVPGLHTRQTSSPSGHATPGTRRPLWLAVALAVVLSAVAAGLWVWQTPDRTGTTRRATQEPVALPPPVRLSVPPPVLIAAPARVAPAVAPAADLAPAVSARPTPTATRPAAPAVQPAAKQARATTTTTASAPAPAAKPTPPPAAVAPARPANAAAAAVPLLSELPEDLRRQLPPLTITGAVYSDNPAQRLLLINNLVLPQGGLAAPEVTLEEIRPRSSVFSFHGTRFRVPH